MIGRTASPLAGARRVFWRNSETLHAAGIRDSIRFLIAVDTIVIGGCAVVLGSLELVRHSPTVIVLGVGWIITGFLWPLRRWQGFGVSTTFILAAGATVSGGATWANTAAMSALMLSWMCVIGIYACVVHGWLVIGGYGLLAVSAVAGFVAVADDDPSGHGSTTTIVVVTFVLISLTANYVTLFGRLALSRYATRLADQASRDPLTGALNRRGLLEAGVELFDRLGPQECMFLAVADLDRFKAINDAYGHAAGDQVLQLTTQRIVGATAPHGVVARTGGEEFVVLYPGSAATIENFADIVRTAASFTHQQHQVTASVGATPLHRCAAALTEGDINAAIGRADEAMYDAKSRGGNDVELRLPDPA